MSIKTGLIGRLFTVIGVAAVALLGPARAGAQVVVNANIVPSAWAGVADGTAVSSGNTGLFSIAPLYVFGSDSTSKYIQYNSNSAATFQFLNPAGATPPFNGADANLIATESINVMFTATQASLVAGTHNNLELLRLTVGTSPREGVLAFTARKDAVGNVSGVAVTLTVGGSVTVVLNGTHQYVGSGTGTAQLEFNRIYRITVFVRYTSAGYIGFAIDGRFAGAITADIPNATTGFGVLGNTTGRLWVWTANNANSVNVGPGTPLGVRIYPAITSTVNAGWFARDTFNGPPSNLTSYSWEPSALATTAALPDASRMGIENLSGSPTWTYTNYTASGNNPFRARWLASGAANGNITRTYTSNGSGVEGDIGQVPSLNGWSWVWWPMEFVPNTCSATYSIMRPGSGRNGTVMASVSVVPTGTTNVSILQEGPAANARYLCDVAGLRDASGAYPSHIRFGIYLGFNKTTGEMRYALVDLTSLFAQNVGGRAILAAGRLNQTWPIGLDPGVATATYTFGSAIAMDAGLVAAGVPAAFIGDNYTESGSIGGGLTPAASIPGNWAQDFSVGWFANNFPNGFRSSKPANTNTPDIIWWTLLGRGSSTTTSDFAGSHGRVLTELRGWDIFIPCYLHTNISVMGISNTTRQAFLDNWVGSMVSIIGPLISTGNRVFYAEPVAVQGTTTDTFAQGGAMWAALNAGQALLNRLAQTYNQNTLNNLFFAPITPLSSVAFIGAPGTPGTGVGITLIPSGSYGSLTLMQSIFPGAARPVPSILFQPSGAAILAGQRLDSDVR
ncbi:MAG: hypothetical protein LW822_09495 [Phycisphaeraceae bacterium]|jgi:hypothetical protein|nr:hypothetical protein [Phycisphaeraceae bacterium]